MENTLACCPMGFVFEQLSSWRRVNSITSRHRLAHGERGITWFAHQFSICHSLGHNCHPVSDAIVKARPIQECDAACGISPHKRKSNFFPFWVAYLMVPEISFDCNFDMWSAFSIFFFIFFFFWVWHTWQACLTRLPNPFNTKFQINQVLLALNG